MSLTNQQPLPSTVSELQQLVQGAIAKINAHTQLANDLMNANVDLKATIALLKNDNDRLTRVAKAFEAKLVSLMQPATDADPVSA